MKITIAISTLLLTLCVLPVRESWADNGRTTSTGQRLPVLRDSSGHIAHEELHQFMVETYKASGGKGGDDVLAVRHITEQVAGKLPHILAGALASKAWIKWILDKKPGKLKGQPFYTIHLGELDNGVRLRLHLHPSDTSGVVTDADERPHSHGDHIASLNVWGEGHPKKHLVFDVFSPEQIEQQLPSGAREFEEHVRQGGSRIGTTHGFVTTGTKVLVPREGPSTGQGQLWSLLPHEVHQIKNAQGKSISIVTRGHPIEPLKLYLPRGEGLEENTRRIDLNEKELRGLLEETRDLLKK